MTDSTDQPPPTRDPLRTYRASDEVYLPALARANKLGEPLAAVIRRALIEYAAPRPTKRRNPQRRATDAVPTVRTTRTPRSNPTGGANRGR